MSQWFRAEGSVCVIIDCLSSLFRSLKKTSSYQHSIVVICLKLTPKPESVSSKKRTHLNRTKQTSKKTAKVSPRTRKNFAGKRRQTKEWNFTRLKEKVSPSFLLLFEVNWLRCSIKLKSKLLKELFESSAEQGTWSACGMKLADVWSTNRIDGLTLILC